MKIKKEFIAILLCVSTLGMSACNNQSDSSSPTSGIAASGVEFWTTSVNEMILQDKPDAYEEIKEEAIIKVSAVRNEYESAHIIMTANENISSYDVEMTNLVSSSGDVFEMENITLYNQKYMKIDYNYEKYHNYGVGWYPDAILPFEAAKDAKENKIEKNKNQALYFSFYIPQDQVPGTYTANFTVTYDGNEKTIPVRLEVWDLELGEENHLKTMFLSSWQWQLQMLSNTKESYQTITETLSKYRLSPYYLWVHDEFEELEYQYETHADLAYDWAKNPRNTVFVIPYAEAYMTATDYLNYVGTEGAADRSFDKDIYAGYIQACIEKSFETKFNIMTKAYAHFGSLIDEPEGQGTWSRVKLVSAMFRETVAGLANTIEANKSEYMANYGVTEEFVQEVADAVRSIRHVVTNVYKAEYEEWVDYWCPHWWWLDRDGSETIEEYYGDTDEQWWYGCNGPNSPLPTYHTDDTLLSPRVLSWMQMQYGFEGNVYWGVNNYKDNTIGGNIAEDVYNFDQGHTGANGDGFLLLPGAMYGLDEPVPTRRIEEIRDGMEEYELLYALKEKYAEKGYDFQSVLSHMTENLFSWMNVIADTDTFDYSRSLLLKLLSLAESDAEVAILNVSDDKLGNFTSEVFVKEGYSLQLNGETVTQRENAVGGSIYTVHVLMDNFVNKMTFTIPELQGVNEIDFVFNGKTVVYSPDQAMADGFAATSSLVPASATLVSATGFDGIDSENVIRISVAATDSQANQDIKFSSKEISEIGKNTSLMAIIIYNNSTQTQCITLKAKYTGDRIKGELCAVDLAPGKNIITINALHQKNWERLGSIEAIYMEFGNGVNELAKDYIYFCGYTITNLG